ncbi:hypothetical protein [Nocardia mexicana]|uniref:Uncharacterized protein n=1 Tax=Nocardia mexicana TaxID=279262 RepID=A0A370HE46_9NOCA|nr:hypothetical protein [Nocardia mexicana]RDI55503.1 hypothetical protein DFR68_101336 [Nocardia mexicana]
MILTAAQDVIRVQLENPGTESPPGSGSSTELLRHLVWVHVLATVIAVLCWVRLARGRGTGRGRIVTVAVGTVLIGLASAGAGAVLEAALK